MTIDKIYKDVEGSDGPKRRYHATLWI